MYVYRFEKNGIGPYTSPQRRVGTISYRVVPKTKTEKVSRSFMLEELRSSRSDDRYNGWMKAHSDKRYMYGCPSKKHLRAYFGGNFKPLFANGFRIKRYFVPDDEVIRMGMELAFPVQYHKLQTLKKVKSVLTEKE